MDSRRTTVLVDDFQKSYFTDRAIWHYHSVMKPESTWENPYLKYLNGPKVLNLDSLVEYYYASYRILIVIDFAPSMFTFDPSSNGNLADLLPKYLRELIRLLYEYSVEHQAEIELSVIGVRLGNKPLKVFVHSLWLHSVCSVDVLIAELEESLVYEQFLLKMNNVYEDIQVNFASILKWCFFILTLMNSRAMPLVLFMTDAVNCHLDTGIYNGLIMQYCRADLSFNAISLSEKLTADSIQFGYFPDSSALKFLTKMTGGQYLSTNHLHDILAMLKRATTLSTQFNPMLVKSSSIRDPLDLQPDKTMFLLEEYPLNLQMATILECRLREGFKIFETTKTTIRMILDCHYNCFIQYSIESDEDCNLIKI